jgi:hypothetical protein
VGRGRAFLGFTAESLPSALQSHSQALQVPVHPTVSLRSVDVVAYSEVDDGYKGLRLAYVVPWPLHLEFTSPALSVYGDVFRLMLRQKAVSVQLQEVWRLLMNAYSNPGGNGTTVTAPRSAGGPGPGPAGKDASAFGGPVPAAAVDQSQSQSQSRRRQQVSGVGGKRSTDPASYTRMHARLTLHAGLLQPVWLLRGRMAFVAAALHAHAQVDVTEAAFAALTEALRGARDYAQLRTAQDTFLSSLLAGTFLASYSGASSVGACITRLLANAERFCSLVRAHQFDLAALLTPSVARPAFEEISKAFEADVRLLLLALAGTSSSYGMSLRTRLGFNSFF